MDAKKFRRLLCVVVPAVVGLLAGCSGTTTIRSDLVLESDDVARINLHHKTQTIDLLNDSDTDVRVHVLGKKDRIVSNMVLGGREHVSLSLDSARAVELENETAAQAVVRWTLTNDGRIEYTLAINP